MTWRVWALGGLVACTGEPVGSTDTDVVDSDSDVVIPDTDTDASDTDASDTDETDHTDPQAACTLGVGETTFTPVAADDDVVVVIGPQNGWHVFGAVVCEGIVAGDAFDRLDPDNPTVTWEILDATTLAVLGGYANLRRPMDRGGEAGLLGEFLILRTATYAEVVNRDVVMAFDLMDVAGATVSLSVPIRLVPQPGWTPPDTDVAP